MIVQFIHRMRGTIKSSGASCGGQWTRSLRLNGMGWNRRYEDEERK